MRSRSFQVTTGIALRCRGWRQEGLLRMLENVLAVGEDPQNLVVYAALGSDVATVVIGGKVVMEDRKMRTLDVDALYREVREFCARGLSPEHKARADMMTKLKPYMQAWYRGWEKPVLGKPFYTINSRE